MKKVKVKQRRRRTFSCGCVVFRSQGTEWSDVELLLVKQFSGKDNWGIPKGHVDKGETFEECAVRETREEAGVEVELGARLPDVIMNSKKEEKTVVSYLAKQTCNKEPCSTDAASEVADARWFKVSKLPKIHAYQRSLVEHALDMIFAQLKIKRVIDAEYAMNETETALAQVFRYAPSLDEWISIKKELLKVLPSAARMAYSTRDPITKKQRTNDFERAVAEKWSIMSGRPVVFRDDESVDRSQVA